jgi:hypothetical protein
LSDERQSRAFIAGIRDTMTGNSDTVAVVVTPFNELGTISSSRRVKDAIQDMGAASERLHRLRPVTFRYRQPFADGSTPLQYGLIAEEVADVYPELVAYDKHGQPTAVLYHVLPALILNELQRQHRRLDDQQRTIDTQRREIDALRARLAAQDREVETLRARLRTPSMDLCGRRACS